jgi:hypothetical protein
MGTNLFFDLLFKLVVAKLAAMEEIGTDLFSGLSWPTPPTGLQPSAHPYRDVGDKLWATRELPAMDRLPDRRPLASGDGIGHPLSVARTALSEGRP